MFATGNNYLVVHFYSRIPAQAAIFFLSAQLLCRQSGISVPPLAAGSWKLGRNEGGYRALLCITTAELS